MSPQICDASELNSQPLSELTGSPFQEAGQGSLRTEAAGGKLRTHFIYLFIYFKFFIFTLCYNTVLVLPYTDMNPPRVCMLITCSRLGGTHFKGRRDLPIDPTWPSPKTGLQRPKVPAGPGAQAKPRGRLGPVRGSWAG